MKYPTLGMNPLAAPIVTSIALIEEAQNIPLKAKNPLAAPIVTSSFQNQVLLLKGH